MVDLRTLALRAGFLLVLPQEPELGFEARDREELKKFRDLLVEVQMTSGANLEPDARQLLENLLGGRLETKETILWLNRLVVLLDNLFRGGWKELTLHQKRFFEEEVNPLLHQILEAAM